MTVTAEQVERAIDDLEVTYEEDDEIIYGKYWEGSYWRTVLDWEYFHPLVIDGVTYEPKIETIGQNTFNYEHYRAVFRIGDQFFMKNGWYASHDGAYLDGSIEEVELRSITVEEWFAR